MNRVVPSLRMLVWAALAAGCAQEAQRAPVQTADFALSFGNGTLGLAVGESVELQAQPSDASGQPFRGLFTLQWLSSNPAVVTVNHGDITGVANGTATVSATATRVDTGAAVTASVVVVVGGGADVTAPSTPTGLVATAAGSSQISLSWSASTDNVAVTGYRIMRGGVQVATTAGTSFVVTGLNPSTSYSFQVIAYDAAGNASPASATATATTTALVPVTGLSFPSNGDSPSSAFVAFQFLNPQNNGLPIWGPSGAGATYVWKIKPRQQTGYYATIWWSNNGNFLWDQGASNSFYGAHPYPRGGVAGTVHDWEIATDVGGDILTTRAGTTKQVVKDVWYSQALRVKRNANGTKTLTFYIALPSTADGDVIEFTLGAGYGEVNPPAPALTFGDSPWYADFQHERLSGVLRGLKVFNAGLSDADLFAEASSDTLATTAGRASIWYLNINPTPTDISDKSGAGHHPAWADPAHPAALYTETADVTAPVLSGISASNLTSSGAAISWSTDEGATSQVQYGLSTSYGSNTSFDAALTTAHSQSLSGLSPSTTYHYRVVSQDAAGNSAASPDQTFTTTAAGPPSGTPIAFVQGLSTSNDASATTISAAFSSATVAGQSIVVAVSWGSGGTMSCSDSAGNSYQTVTTRYDAGNNQSLGVCFAPNITGGADTVTVTFSGAAPYRRLAIHQYSGMATTQAVDASANNVGTATTSANAVTSTPAVTTVSGDLIFGAVFDDDGTTAISPGSGFTARLSANGADLATEDLTQTAAGSVSATWSFGAAHRYLAALVAFRRP